MSEHGQILGRRALSSKHALHFVRVGTDVLVIGTGPAGAPAIMATYPAQQLCSPEPAPMAPTPATAAATTLAPVSSSIGPAPSDFPVRTPPTAIVPHPPTAWITWTTSLSPNAMVPMAANPQDALRHYGYGQGPT